MMINASILSTSVVGGSKFNRVVEIGQKAPEWSNLSGVDGKQHSLTELKEAKLVVVIFLRNNCPIAQSYQTRIRDFVEKYRDRKVAVIGINVSAEPGEDLEKMQAASKAQKFSFLYLRDESQQIGKAFGATNTPHVFVLDAERRIGYMGAIDDSNKPDKVTEHYLDDAVTALLDGKNVDIPETLQRGCHIFYKGDVIPR